jgi:hypothetical protein
MENETKTPKAARPDTPSLTYIYKWYAAAVPGFLGHVQEIYLPWCIREDIAGQANAGKLCAHRLEVSLDAFKETIVSARENLGHDQVISES